jgi:uncharacterized protein YkwD
VPPLRPALRTAACTALAAVALAACSGAPDPGALAVPARAVLPATTAAPPTSEPPVVTTDPETTSDDTAPVSTAPKVRVAVEPPARTPSPAPRAVKAPPAPPSRPAPATPKAAASTSAAGQVLALVNAERARAGCKAVTLDDRLTKAAAGHSRDMATEDFFSHDSQDGAGFADRIRAAGYPAPRSENIAAGQATPAAVMDAWMHSAGHKANILDCKATEMGIAAATGGDFGIYWTQDFGTA